VNSEVDKVSLVWYNGNKGDGRMKYHRWDLEDGHVRCRNCGVRVGANVRPRRVTACPPTPFERDIIRRINYGSLSEMGSNFDGLHICKIDNGYLPNCLP